MIGSRLVDGRHELFGRIRCLCGRRFNGTKNSSLKRGPADRILVTKPEAGLDFFRMTREDLSVLAFDPARRLNA